MALQSSFRQDSDEKVALLDLLPQPRARRYSDVASIDGASYLIFNGDLPAYFDPSAASASSPLIRSDNFEALSRPPHRPAAGCCSAPGADELEWIGHSLSRHMARAI